MLPPVPSHADSPSARPAFFLTAHFSEEDYPYDWLMLWLSRRPEWQRSREFETTTRSSTPGFGSRIADNSFGDDDEEEDEGAPGRVKTRVVFQPTSNTTHTIYYRGHWLRVRRWRKNDSGNECISVSVVARNNSILKQLVLQAKKEYEAEAVHRIQIYFADSHGCWRWTDSRHKRPMSSIVLNPGVKEMLLSDTKDFLKSEKVRKLTVPIVVVGLPYTPRHANRLSLKRSAGACADASFCSGMQIAAFRSAEDTCSTVCLGRERARSSTPLLAS